MRYFTLLIIIATLSCSSTKKDGISTAKKTATPIAFTSNNTKMDSTELPYHSIKEYPSDFRSGNIVSRTIDGLGYRYYWATKDLRPEDLAYKISEDSRSAEETLEHLFGLASMIRNTATLRPNVRPRTEVKMTWPERRQATLELLKEASDAFATMDAQSISEAKIVFERNGEASDVSFWHILNGPIADALTHVGQIVSYRRAAGNPQDPTVNVFMGKNRGS